MHNRTPHAEGEPVDVTGIVSTPCAERAQSQGQTLAEYCRQSGVSVHALFSAGRQLKAKGVLPGPAKRRQVRRKPGKFIAVGVADPVPAVVCRLRHPTGWVIECANWPDPSWTKLDRLLQAGRSLLYPWLPLRQNGKNRVGARAGP